MCGAFSCIMIKNHTNSKRQIMITQPYPSFIDPEVGGRAKPVSNGTIFIGKNQKDPIQFPEKVYYTDSKGTEIEMAQPIYLNSAGVTIASKNSPDVVVRPYTKIASYSILIRNSGGNDRYQNNSVSGFATEDYVDQKVKSETSNKTSFFESDSDLQSTLEDVPSNATVITSHHSSQQDHNGATYEVIEAANHVGVIEEFGDIQMQNRNVAVKSGYSNETNSIRYWSHRGGFRGTVENTLYAFSKALEDGAYGIEADISWSSDGVPYVFHDIDVSLLTNGTGNIYELTSTQINNLRFKAVVGTRYENLIRIPTLAQFIEFCERKACPVTLELKLPRPASQESDRQAAIDMIKASPLAKNFVIQVTTGAAAEQVRNSTLDVKTAFSYASFTNYETELYSFKKWRVNQIMISSDSLSKPNVDQAIILAKKLGFELIGYTSQNTKTNVYTLASKGFFNIISDRGFEK